MLMFGCDKRLPEARAIASERFPDIANLLDIIDQRLLDDKKTSENLKTKESSAKDFDTSPNPLCL